MVAQSGGRLTSVIGQRANKASSRLTSASALGQSPIRGCRNSRALGYQGLSARSWSQRQSPNGRQQQPERLAQGPGEMRDRGVDRDHQVERGDRRRGVGEIGERVVEAEEGRCGKRRAVGLAVVLLQADECDARRLQQRRKQRQRDAAVAVVLVRRLARPDQADARRFRPRQPRAPCSNAFGRRAADRAPAPGSSSSVVPKASGRLISGQCTSNGGSALAAPHDCRRRRRCGRSAA